MKTRILFIAMAVAVLLSSVCSPAYAGTKNGESQDSLLFAQTVKMLNEGEFVIETDRIIMPDGTSVMVSSITNFISVQGGNAVIQVSPLMNASGANGVGGLTVEGSVGKVSTDTDKRGNFIMNMTVIGANVSVTVSITVPKGSNRANVWIDPNYNSDDITMMGSVVSPAEADIHTGISRY